MIEPLPIERGSPLMEITRSARRSGGSGMRTWRGYWSWPAKAGPKIFEIWPEA
jgi:hypothetical protein